LHLGVDLVVRLPGGHSESFTPIKGFFFSKCVCKKYYFGDYIEKIKIIVEVRFSIFFWYLGKIQHPLSALYREFVFIRTSLGLPWKPSYVLGA